eukprot:775438-Amphidinium_carterae.1
MLGTSLNTATFDHSTTPKANIEKPCHDTAEDLRPKAYPNYSHRRPHSKQFNVPELEVAVRIGSNMSSHTKLQ